MSLSRNLQLARHAYEKHDAEMSIAAHMAPGQAVPTAEEHAGEAGDMIKSLVFGGLDGIVTTFAIVAAVAGASLSPDMVILMGVANLIADGLSMGLGDFLSEVAENGHVINERKRELWEMENCLEGEKQEMVELYKTKGISEADATLVIDTLSKYKDFFVDHMLVVELGLLPVEDTSGAWRKGLVTFVSFLCFGSVPILTYGALGGVDWGNTNVDMTFVMACITTAITLFMLGVAKAKLTKQSMLENGALMLLNGGLAASAAYIVGYALEQSLSL